MSLISWVLHMLHWKTTGLIFASSGLHEVFLWCSNAIPYLHVVAITGGPHVFLRIVWISLSCGVHLCWCGALFITGLKTWMLTVQLCQLNLGVKTFLWCPCPVKEVIILCPWHPMCLYILERNTPWHYVCMFTIKFQTFGTIFFLSCISGWVHMVTLPE